MLNPDRWLARLEDRWAAEEFAEPEPEADDGYSVHIPSACTACDWRGGTETTNCPACGGELGEDDE